MSVMNKIFHGDCLNYLGDSQLFPDNQINLILTSPPYADKRAKSYDGVNAEKYVDWFLPISLQLKRILKDDGSFILNIKEHPENGERQTYVIELILALRQQGWYWAEEYCWYKKNSFPGKWPNRFRDSWERCLHFTKNKKFKMYQDEVMVPIGDWAERRFKSMSESDFIRYTSRNNSNLGRRVANWLNRKKVYPHNVLVFEKEHYLEPSNVLEFATECSNKNHSAAFPIELPTWYIKLFTKEGDLVLDPFLGSGTTAVASVLLNRNYLGMEKKKEYFDEAIKNIFEVQELMSAKCEC
jgi:site-specific DNA-methyltransferase (adenine-specific)